MEKTLAVVLAGTFVVGVLTGCGVKKEDSSKKETKKIVVGASPSPHADILKAAKKQLRKEGYTLEITDLNILTGDIFGIYIDDLECKERLINLISLLEIPSKGNIKIGGIDTNDKRYQTY